MAKQSKLPSWLPKIAVPSAYTLWVVGAFIAVQLLIGAVLLLLVQLGVPLASVSPVVFATVLSVIGYGLTLFAVVWLPKKILSQKTTKKELGISRLPGWLDIALGPAAFLPYMLVSAFLLLGASKLFPWIDVAQEQELGFSTNIFGVELALAFLLFVVLAPLVEEVLFRGYLYGKLRKGTNVVVSALLVSICFGVLHGQVNVGIDTFALSIVLCLLREFTGSIWAGVLLHAAKNGLAFYLLFINPSLLSTIGG